MNMPSENIVNAFTSVHSDHLKHLRAALHQWKELQPVLGDIARFRVVVDTNIVLGDLIWLCKKRKNPEASTDLMEVIAAETIDVYAPPALLDEVEEKIPLLAADKGIDVGLLLKEWEQYKPRLKVKEPEAARVTRLKHGVDPDDAFFVALAEDISAHGVITKDRHIEMMGGNWITVECVTSLRDYSRAIAVSMEIKVSGVVLSGVAIGAVRQLLLGIKALASAISRAPDWVKLVLIAGAFFVIFHPGARAKMVQWVQSVVTGIEGVTPLIAEHIAEAAALSEKHGAEANAHLEKAMLELDRQGRGSK
ncbi:PIN domain-containing protein [Mariprofundus erugo]|uniref:PIN domain-containing protein n=1 Tax=Mariprofundus erugo TaxID=2528639 RepID=A0A5R9GK67_9PROT|nr:PIN domain-containing protein [Mariprofundus erugo]TLS66188.1 PIN domain-containing protein [Mariprofundus erugo]